MAAKANRGPGVAAENRAALVAAARAVFNEQGFNAPLQHVARRAGVGQGSLYRHFPDRASLALAAFEENVEALERVAANDVSTLDECFVLLVAHSQSAAGFMSALVGIQDPRITGLGERVVAALATKLPSARLRGHVRPDVSAEDCLLAMAMLGALVGHAPQGERARVAREGWLLLRRSLVPEQSRKLK